MNFSLPVAELLKQQGAFVSYNDPYIRHLSLVGPPAGALESEPLSAAFLATQDGVILVTDHSAYNYDWIVRHASLVLDTRNAVEAAGADCCRVLKT